MITVLLADDQALVRAGFRALLDAQDDIDVVGEAADGERRSRLAARAAPGRRADGHPDARASTGWRRPGRSPPTRRWPARGCVILTTFDLDEYVFEALRVGASGFLVKDTEPAELLQAVRAVAAGDALLSPSVTRRLIEHVAVGAKPLPHGVRTSPLTEREREIVALVGEGLSNDEIADRLVVSPATAKTHVSRAMVKLGARDRAQLVVLAYESGLVRPGWLG